MKKDECILLYRSARSFVLIFLEREDSVLYRTSWVVADNVRTASSWGMQNTFESCSAVTPFIFPAVTDARVAKGGATDEVMIASKISHESLQTDTLPIAIETCDKCARSDNHLENIITSRLAS